MALRYIETDETIKFANSYDLTREFGYIYGSRTLTTDYYVNDIFTNPKVKLIIERKFIGMNLMEYARLDSQHKKINLILELEQHDLLAKSLQGFKINSEEKDLIENKFIINNCEIICASKEKFYSEPYDYIYAVNSKRKVIVENSEKQKIIFLLVSEYNELVKELGDLSILAELNLDTHELVAKTLNILKTRKTTEELRIQEQRVNEALQNLANKERKLNKLIETAIWATSVLTEKANKIQNSKSKKRWRVF